MMEPHVNYAAEVLDAPLTSANIKALLDEVGEAKDQVSFKLLVAELFSLSNVDLHAQLLSMATEQPEVCVAAGGAMLQSLRGVVTTTAIRRREIICSTLSLASAEIVTKDRTSPCHE